MDMVDKFAYREHWDSPSRSVHCDTCWLCVQSLQIHRARCFDVFVPVGANVPWNYYSRSVLLGHEDARTSELTLGSHSGLLCNRFTAMRMDAERIL